VVVFLQVTQNSRLVTSVVALSDCGLAKTWLQCQVYAVIWEWEGP